MKVPFLFCLLLVTLLSVQLFQFATAQIRSVYQKNISFKFYDEVGETYQENTIRDEEEFQYHVRSNKDKVAIIVHGWRESCSVDWIKMLIHNLNEFRGGVIICMDYSYFSMEENYFRLVKHFDGITDVLTVKLKDLEEVGYDPDNMYLFGFSFGGQSVVEAGKRFGIRRIKNIDACDMAGPGFDSKPTTDHRLAAQNVQCIHTSRDKGTKFSLCNQNWKMGNCGQTQDAAGRPPFGNHGLCPYFYNLAFHHPFYAVKRPKQCRAKNEASKFPSKFRMGYLEERQELVQGELFAMTSKNFPFNVVETSKSASSSKKNKKKSGYYLEDQKLNYSQFENAFDWNHGDYVLDYEDNEYV